MFLRGLIFFLLLNPLQAQVLSSGRPEDVGMSSERLAQLDEVLEASITEEETPGAVVLVARRGRIVYLKSLGHRARLPRREAMTLDTLFDVASLTKVMATAPLSVRRVLPADEDERCRMVVRRRHRSQANGRAGQIEFLRDSERRSRYGS